jgi:hypothetical protein
VCARNNEQHIIGGDFNILRFLGKRIRNLLRIGSLISLIMSLTHTI